jgi:hypothetical protein
MPILVDIIGAYVIVGPIYVHRKLAERNYVKVPFGLMRYRTEGGIGRLINATLSWPIATFINREFGYWLFFAIVTAILYYLSSI